MLDQLKAIQSESRMKEALRYVKPVFIDKNLIRLGSRHDGGYVLAEDLLNSGISYSLGVGGNSWFDMVLESKGYSAYLYDYTQDHIIKDGKEYIIPEDQNIFFNKIGIDSYNHGNFKTIDQIIKDNKHTKETNMLLQCDIEGSEWDIFSHISQSTLTKFSQILIEFHTLYENMVDDIKYNKMLTSFKNLAENFVPFHVHGNNCSIPPTFKIDGKDVPNTLEVSYARKDLVEILEGTPVFPTKLDSPNHRAKPDIELGTFTW